MHARAAHVLAFALYLLFAIVLTFPLAVRLATAVPNDLGDPLLNIWILWWNATHVPLTASWWNAPAFFPAENVLTFSEHLLGLSPIASPVYWLTGSALASYNVVFLLTFPLSAFAAYLLCLHLTDRRDAAFLGGLAFGFAPYRISQMAHVQVLASFWMPVALLGLHRFVRGDGWRWLVLFAAMWLMQALTNGYYMAFFSVLVAIWIAWFVPWRRLQTIGSILLAWGLAFAAVLPVLMRYRLAHESFGFRRLLDEVLAFSADLSSIFDASGLLAVWGHVHSLNRPEDELFPGLTVVVLTVAGCLIATKNDLGFRFTKNGKRNPRSFLPLTLFLLGVILTIAAVIAVVSPGETSIAGIPFSANHPEKPMRLAMLCFIASVFTSRAVWDAIRRRSSFAFYIAGAVVMWLMTLGPTLNLLQKEILPTAPYALLLHIPGWPGLRVPARFAMLMVLCVAIAAALAYSRVTKTVSPSRRALLTSILTLALLGDAWMTSMPLEGAPAPWPRGTTHTMGAILSLPLGDPGDDITAMYRTIWHGRPIVNGYSGYFPPWYPSLRLGLDTKDPRLLDELGALGVTEIVLDTSLDPDGAWDRYARTRAAPLGAAGGLYTTYRLSAGRSLSSESPSLGAALPIKSIEVNVKKEEAAAMTDGDLQTRWDTGPQTGKEEVLIDLGTVRPITTVVLQLGPFNADFPRDLQIETSDDQRSWTEAWRGSTTILAFVTAVRDPRRVPLVFPLGNREARFIRLRQLGQDPTYYWSVAELSLH
jgi:F5/8 type C domain-containing protein